MKLLFVLLFVLCVEVANGQKVQSEYVWQSVSKYNRSLTSPRLVPCSSSVSCSMSESSMKCDSLPTSCLECLCNLDCHYGSTMNGSEHSMAVCKLRSGLDCQGEGQRLLRPFRCQLCFQTPEEDHVCEPSFSCSSTSPSESASYITNCTVKPDVICLGRRSFQKRLRCNFSAGYSWSDALFYSIFLGGFGVDRFYLGHWEEGMGKLFSFGGLGVWTLIDVVLVAIGYIGPHDGSLYIS